MNRLSFFSAALPLLVVPTIGCSVDLSPAPEIQYAKFDMLCDFERGSNLNPDLKFSGSFLFDADKSPGMHVFHGQSDMLPSPVQRPGGITSTFAFHAMSDGSNTNWGTAWQAPFISGNLPVDLSGYTGISFWAKSDALPVPVVKFALPDLGSYAMPGGLTPSCDPTDNRPVGNGCYDDYSVRIYPDGEWRRYDIPFGSLTNGGWGIIHALDLTKIYAIKFAMLPAVQYSIWIDDIYLYLRP